MNNRLHILLLSCGALALAGCLSAPAPENSTTPWTPPARARASDKVWKDLRAPRQDFSKPLTLAELTDLGLQDNPASRKAWNDARVAAAQVAQARGLFMPTVTGTAGVDREHTSATPTALNQNYLQYGPALQLNYTLLYFGGGRQAAVEQALQSVYAANFTFNRSIQDVLLSVATAYYGLVSAEAGVTAAEAGVKDAQQALDAARERRDAGVGTELDVLQAQASLDQAQYTLAGAQGQARTARGTLAQAVGVPADTPLAVQPLTDDVPAGYAAQDMQRMIDEALNRRPDIAALRATLAAQVANVQVKGSALWPTLNLTGHGSRDYYSDRSSGAIPYPDRDWVYGGGLSLQWTLFDGFQTLNARRAARAQADSTREQLKQAALAASADVWTRYYAFDTALQKFKFSAAFLHSTQASYDLALDSYKAGLKSILDLLNAETQLAQARSQNIGARQDAFTALASLAYATGVLEKGGATHMQDVFTTPLRKEIQP